MKEPTYEIMETGIGTYTVRVREPGRKTYLLHDGFRTREGAAEWIRQQRQGSNGAAYGSKT